MDAPVFMIAPEGQVYYITKTGRYYAAVPGAVLPIDAHDVDELRAAGYRPAQPTPPATIPGGEQIAPGYVPAEAPLLPEPEPQPEPTSEPTSESTPEPTPEFEPPAEPTPENG